MKMMNNVVDNNVDIFDKNININDVYCKHKCAVKANVVYVVTCHMS